MMSMDDVSSTPVAPGGHDAVESVPRKKILIRSDVETGTVNSDERDVSAVPPVDPASANNTFDVSRLTGNEHDIERAS